MTNVASLELCRELYELSGWGGTASMWTNDYHQYKPDGTPDWKWEVTMPFTFTTLGNNYPAYDAGFLLRKLEGFDVSLEYSNQWRRYSAFAHEQQGFEVTAENALTKLAIELFKQKVLTKEEV